MSALKLALQGDGRRAPTWLTTLELARLWGKTPEEIRAMPNGVKWAARQAALNEAIKWKQDLDAGRD